MAEHPAGHLVLKWLIEQDAKMKEAEREGKYKMSNPDTLTSWVTALGLKA